MGEMKKLQQKIIDLCNESNLPIECIVYILKDAWRDAEATLQNIQAQFPQPVPPMGENNIEEEEE